MGGWTVRSVLAWSVPWLKDRGVEAPRLDAELLLASALGVRRLDLYLDPDRPLNADELGVFKPLLRRRGRREPVAYILGRRSFWTLELEVVSGVLIPRPESEGVVEAVLDRFGDRSLALSILDLGVGCGTLLLSLLSEYPEARGTGVDLAPEPLECCARNGRRLGVMGRMRLFAGDLTDPLEDGERFDVIVCNPPYVGADELAGLAPEVRDWEPRLALLGGDDGLAVIRRLLPRALGYLRAGGWLVVEIGAGQAEAVLALFREQGFDDVRVKNDYGGRPRVVTGQAPGGVVD
ncbi:MAG: peptide chain release factor N(5)-glutamine methyltransferase [Magnetococcales bacterium]|nr:peptide chain release factor N(5)-glutamine methyltransferase [Magnetococcales bacterium]